MLKTIKVSPQTAAQFANSNKTKIQACQEHIARGGQVYLEMGCGQPPEFATKLAAAEQAWVTGIDVDQIPFSSDFEAAMQEYDKYNHFLYLPGPYSEILDTMNNYDWLIGKVHKTFLIMPDPNRTLEEEFMLFRAFTCETGEIHIRTEQMKHVTQLINLLDQYHEDGYEEIAFHSTANNISTSTTKRLSQYIRSMGFCLIPSPYY